MARRWAPPDLGHWSPPTVIASGGGAGRAGHMAVHVVAGSAGRLDLAYLAGFTRAGRSPAWYATVAQIDNARSARPRISETRLARFASYTGTASALAGVCGSGPTAGLEQGLTCPRATDNFGLALRRDCQLAVVWPAVTNEVNRSRTGTFVSVQQRGPKVC
jgi:hypothetical protein